MMRSIVALALFTVVLAACEGAVIESGTNRVVDGATVVRAPGGQWAPTGAGPVAFPTGTVVEATAAGATLDASIGGDARAKLQLGPGAQLSRRGAQAFDLLAGTLTVSTTGLVDRMLVYHADHYVEAGRVAAGDQTFTVTAVGEQLAVVVERGGLQLNTLNSANRELSYATLGEAEQGLATNGAKPEKRHTDDAPDGPFLTPRVWLDTVSAGSDDPLRLEVWFASGQSGAFRGLLDTSDTPDSLVLSASGPGGARDIPLGAAHLRQGGELSRTIVLNSANAEYGLEFDVPDHGLTAGDWKLRVRYISYREHFDGPEWIGVVESADARVTIPD